MRQHGPFRSLKKVSNREIRRRATEAINVGTTALHLLLTVLAQKGGEVVVTQGTIDQCALNLNELDFEIADGDKKGEFVIRLLEGVKGAGTRVDPTKFKDAANSIQMPPYVSTDEPVYMGDDELNAADYDPGPPPDHDLHDEIDKMNIARMEGGE